MFHERMKVKAIESLVGLLKACHRNVIPTLIADIISVLRGFLFTPNPVRCPIRSLAVKSCPDVKRNGLTSNTKKILVSPKQMMGKSIRLLLLNKLDCLLRHLLQMTGNVKMSRRVERQRGVDVLAGDE